MKRKILIVEDNVGLSQIQKDWLSQAGYEAVTAMNEPIARSLIRRTQFDLILSDVRLPEGDGISLLEWLRKERKDIPFILTTEYVSVSDVVRTIKLGARDYLPKPVHREHLEREGAVSPNKPQDSASGKVCQAGCSVRYVGNDSRCQRNRQRIDSTNHP